MVFQFEHIVLDQQPGGEKWDLAPLPLLQLKQVIRRWQKELEGAGWNSIFWENHDLPRIVSRWGDDGKYRVKSAKMLAMLLFGLQGTPYIYQGQELGMANARYPLEDYRDIETLGIYRKRKALGYSEEEILRSIHAKSRDNARTPMHWSAETNAGFTTGVPWLKVNPNYPEINAEKQIEYRGLFLRKERGPAGRFLGRCAGICQYSALDRHTFTAYGVTPIPAARS